MCHLYDVIQITNEVVRRPQREYNKLTSVKQAPGNPFLHLSLEREQALHTVTGLLEQGCGALISIKPAYKNSCSYFIIKEKG